MNAPSAHRIAVLGAVGSRSERAARALYPNADIAAIARFSELVRSVERGRAEIAIAPVESSTSGRVAEVYQVLASMNLHIVGEHFAYLSHALAAPAAAKAAGSTSDRIAALETIYAAAEGAALGREPLETLAPGAELRLCSDERAAADAARAAQNGSAGALLSPQRIEEFSFDTLVDPVEGRTGPATRYFLLAREPIAPTAADGPAVTTVLFQVRHTPGALAEALRVFAEHQLNLAKLETYLVSGNAKEPTFHVDVGASRSEPQFAAALDALIEHVAFIKILGSYPASPMRTDVDGFLPI